ncbi:MAG: hypothetical protein DI539_19220 [Flavobacterium psychrophilum]|nr:MAG: hypothetical protein DI539_19220 [Flavobacterium psychrophilum]
MRIFFIFFLLINTVGFSQESVTDKGLINTIKPIIDDSAIQNWEFIPDGTPIITENGKFFAYRIAGKNSPRRIILQSIDNDWKHDFGRVDLIGFSKNSRYFIYKAKDSLCFYNLQDRKLFRAIAGIKNSQLPAATKKLSWLESEGHEFVWAGWQFKKDNDLYLYNLVTGKEYQYKDIANYLFDQQGKFLVLKKLNNSIEWIDLVSHQSYIVWTGKTNDIEPGAMTIDYAGKQLAFILQEKHPINPKNSVWLYRQGLSHPMEKANNQSTGIDSGLTISNSISFNQNAKYIDIILQRTANPKIARNDVHVDIWNYKDTLLQSVQLHAGSEGLLEPQQYMAKIDISSNRLIQLTHKFGDRIGSSNVGDYIVICSNTSGDHFWQSSKDSNWLVSLKTGEKKLLTVNSEIEYNFSPNGKYLLYYDPKIKNYLSIDLTTNKTMNLTAMLKPLIMANRSLEPYTYALEQPGKKLILNWTIGVAGWMEGGGKVLVYDDFDVWQLDVSGSGLPINLTGGYGRENNIRFRLASRDLITGISWKVPLLLMAFNCYTKQNGFYQLFPNQPGKLQQFTISSHTYYHPPKSVYTHINSDPGMPPIRAGNLNQWLVKRQSNHESVNYYLTHDFKNFKALTNITPEKNYNFLQSELITWTRPDGDINQGILYKPDNFDPNKRYPLLVSAYSRHSDALNRYLRPNYSSNPIFDIPYMVSRGYLVFVPDIHYMLGGHGRSGLISVETGIQAIAQLPYVDTSRMALTGHSFSGQTAYYIAANSHLFKAVIAGAGWTDMISSYLQLAGAAGKAKTESYMGFLEGNFSHYSIWERPELYQAESPVLSADKIRTPLLIFHNQGDGKPFEQAVEMFLSLRRLEKPVWMLQYDDAGHIVGGKQSIDFTIRITQFFDHYLKGLSAPRWMTRGIRANQKGIDDGYELDKSGKCGLYCNVCNRK